MRRTSVVVLSALLGLTLALPAAAQWKWRDKGGQIQYSDLPPPPGTPDKDILQRPLQSAQQPRRVSVAGPSASAASAPASASKGVDPELEARHKKAEQEQASKQKAADDERVAAAKAENCARAKGYMRALDDGIRIVRNDEKGERQFLDDKQRAEEARRTREIIASDCK
jgi:hypothetical protein